MLRLTFLRSLLALMTGVASFVPVAHACTCLPTIADPCVVADSVRGTRDMGFVALARVLRYDSIAQPWGGQVTQPAYQVEVTEVLSGLPDADTAWVFVGNGADCGQHWGAAVGDIVLWLAVSADTIGQRFPTFCSDFQTVYELGGATAFTYTNFLSGESRTVTLDELRGAVACDPILNVDDARPQGAPLTVWTDGTAAELVLNGATPRNADYLVLDATGRVLAKSPSPRVPLSDAAHGVYVALVRDDRGRVVAAQRFRW